MSRDTTLAQAVFGDLTLARQAGLVLAGSVLIAIAAQFSIFIGPVPLSLQTLAILAWLRARRAAGGGDAGALPRARAPRACRSSPAAARALPYMMGPTGGFLLGFVAMAWLAGWASDRA
jgi:biotin transport system substrate-specific component